MRALFLCLTFILCVYHYYMENIQKTKIDGSLRYGQYAPKLYKVFYITFYILFVVCLGSVLFMTFNMELEDQLFVYIFMIVLDFLTLIGGVVLHFINSRHEKLIKRCLEDENLRRSRGTIGYLGVSGVGFEKPMKISLTFKLDGHKYERQSRSYRGFFHRVYRKHKKVDIVYSPTYDEVLFLKME